MKRMDAFFAAIVIVLSVIRGARADDMTLKDLFVGHFVATGQIRNLIDGTTRSLTSELRGVKQGDRIHTIEDTRFSDGERRIDEWMLDIAPDGRLIGHNPNLVSGGVVEKLGGEIVWKYRVRFLAKGGPTRELDFDKRFFVTSPTAARNTVRVSYFFIQVADGSISIRRLSK